MCGIAGYWGEGNRKILEDMTRSISYRGPDDEGFFTDNNVGLGHRRLSILDLSPAGHQPMASEAGDVIIVFNGEIYNFRELGEKIKVRHDFKSQTDTEVILHLYEEIGEKVFTEIQGMFALAIYDRRKGKIILARDRMGKKPLYWFIAGRSLIFGSEIKALMKHPLFKKELDLASLSKYLTYEYVPTPKTIFSNTQKLKPGHFLSWNGKELKTEKFWEVEFGRAPVKDFKDGLIKLDQALNQAVSARMISDVPLGVFLSGGIDSSAIAYYAQKNSSSKIKTFTISFKEESFGEARFARQVARHLGTDHHEKEFSHNDCLELLPRIARLLDEPLADPSILPTFILSGFTRERASVALGGDGGDELFLGYDTFLAHQAEYWYERLPGFFRKGIIERGAGLLPTSLNNISWDFAVKSFVRGFDGEKKYRYQRWLAAFLPKDKSELFTPEVFNQLSGQNEFEEIDVWQKNVERENYFNQLTNLYLRTYLMDDILTKVDRAGMYNSLEVRSPFLDASVVDLANSFPIGWKLKGFKTKYILKKLMQGRLPEEIIWRKKKGFGIPLARWLAGPLKELVLDYLSAEALRKQGIFNPRQVERLLNEHFSGKKDNRKQIWTLLIFQMWSKNYLE
ncbi:MAG: asparagine synthase (glutamine-hydrolyzing) [Patescibacteria group bacterium]|jgi:asparagine synthase (glutamine-hydrolysing)